jgi:hypothetical protein
VDDDGGAGTDAPADAASAGDGPGDVCEEGVISGVGVPPGTVATASTSRSGDTPDHAIDGTLTTQWNAAMPTGWIEFAFSQPTTIGAVRIRAHALPASSETYTVTTGDGTTTLGSVTAQVDTNPNGTVLPDITIPIAAYSTIRITGDGGASWLAVDEIWLLAAPCQ